ncbi:hypothetical protein [Nocardia fluminea]|uniref:hypothetical protein n=1 Tax=Nocardia fluminea TaxID=134984 RepID=UPI00365E10AD
MTDRSDAGGAAAGGDLVGPRLSLTDLELLFRCAGADALGLDPLMCTLLTHQYQGAGHERDGDNDRDDDDQSHWWYSSVYSSHPLDSNATISSRTGAVKRL